MSNSLGYSCAVYFVDRAMVLTAERRIKTDSARIIVLIFHMIRKVLVLRKDIGGNLSSINSCNLTLLYLIFT